VKVDIFVERLGDQLRADRLALLVDDDASLGLPGEQRPSDERHDRRVDPPKKDEEDDRDANRCEHDSSPSDLHDVEGRENQVDELDPEERSDDAANAVDRDIAPQ
jgi:hypothetical protein